MMQFKAAFFALAIFLTPQFAFAEQAGSSAAPAAITDWTKRVTTSPRGGHILGNPLARHRITEYVSYSCPHCGSFQRQSHIPFRANYIAKGHVNLEIRNLVRDPFDLAAAALARCGGRAKFFANHNAILSTQPDWLARGQSASAVTRKRWAEQQDYGQRLIMISRDIGLFDVVATNGIKRLEAEACLTDSSIRQTLADLTKFARDRKKIQGTPSFTLNGTILKNVHGWAALKIVLDRLPKN